MKKNYTLITGASSGIGREIAIRLSNSYNLVLGGRDEEKLLQVKEACNANNNHLIWKQDLNEVNIIEQDLTDLISLNDIYIENFVHSAGFMKMVPLKMSTLDVLNRTFNTNVLSASLISKVLTQKKVNNATLKAMVFISSNISNMGGKAMSAYGASKGAIDSLMRCLAVELAPNIRVNSVLPGAVMTEMTKKIFEQEEIAQRMADTYPLGIGMPEDIYQMVNFLLSDKAKWITGQQFTVDGGRAINISA